ncbi:tetratricopeptide repeat protein [Wukongibacter baidiensis]|uniref:tetratricopeptide repeat protein n=1 Tax=Wukongibacter baidiensis TaxID=1723361 RepID=UPI003D7F6C24
MKKKNTIAINTHFINNRIQELGLKRSWLAERIGVDRKTISRWTTGKVKYIADYNAEALAKCLEATIQDISDNTDIYTLGTQLDKELAVKEIISEDLLLLLSPTGNWRLIETIIKSTISPGLSKENIGKLYNWLSITKWRMKNYDDAIVFANKALEIGDEIGDKAISLKALFNLGTIESLMGNNVPALEFYLKCYELKEYFETKMDLASLCTNLSMVYRDMVSFKESIYFQKEAVRLFTSEERNYNLAIAHQCFGYIYTEIGEFNKAIESLNKAIEYAKKSNYQAGLVTINLYKLDAVVLSNRFEDINDDIEAIINRFLNEDYNDSFCFEYIARYYRIMSRILEAEKVIKIGLKKIQNNPVAEASLWHERARLALIMENLEAEKSYREKGNSIYINTSSKKRVVIDIIPEYGRVFFK